RTGSDLEMLLRHDLRPRLVKGAYAGDYDDYEEIQNRLKRHVLRVRDTSGAISIGTHDPRILAWLADALREERHRIHLGFLMGLADATKEGLAGAGWTVWEYVPVGTASRPYILRRERYLAEHRVRGTAPAP
ncbi:MAG: hypothetical protein GKC04_08780, partial [Methanomicrobiales archaeon]|nr:hypothetical protein [Methanomicrobiales archaeon]